MCYLVLSNYCVVSIRIRRVRVVRYNNQGTIAIARNPVYHARTKHIGIKYPHVREALTNGVIDLVFCRTQQIKADILTKPLSRDQFVKLCGAKWD